MRYITTNQVSADVDYLLIGYKNRFDQFDVAKLKLTLLSSYYIPTEKVVELSNMLIDLSAFLSSSLDMLSVDGDKITVMELSAYCSRAHLNELLDERTFITTGDFMNYLKNNFETKNGVSAKTCLLSAGHPLSVAAKKIEDMFKEAYAKKPKKEE